MKRDATRALRVGNVPVGGGAPVSVQTMLNDDPHDEAALVAHLRSCAEEGADIVRLTIPDLAAADTLARVRAASPVPIVSDIHFDYRCALAAIAAGADALRLNPGNIGGRERVAEVARAAKAHGVPIRIGVNFGSLEKELDAAVRRGELPVAEALCRSALGHLKLLEDEGFREVAISVKASNVADTLAAYRLLAERTDCPLHVGLTEAGTFLRGTVHSSVALGILLAEGIGDTIRVSLTDTPEREVRVGLEILRALGMRPKGPSVTSCPTCGRTRVGLKAAAEAVEAALAPAYRRHLAAGRPEADFPRVAVMGCVVNGPGEAKGADIALCGGAGEFILFVKGEAVGRVPERDAAARVADMVAGLEAGEKGKKVKEVN